MGRAEELFLRIKTRGAAEVHDMIGERFVEELFLDYKRSSTRLPARKLSDEDRKNLAKAIAGFGNSEGGVVVWGVDCRQTDEGDVPTAPIPVTNPLALKTLFDGAVGGLTLPAHSSVENIHLLDSQGTDGFVLTYVPAGLHVPYQTLFPRQEYYIRAGSTFLPVPHGVLAGMFGRTPQPYVMPIITFQSVETVQNTPPSIRILLQVTLSNQGRGLAEDVFCSVEQSSPSGNNLSYAHSAGLRRMSTTRNGRTSFTAMLENGYIIPPGAEVTVFTMVINVAEPGKGDYCFTVAAGSRNGPGAATRLEFPARAVDEALAHYTFRYDTVAARQAAERVYLPRLVECVPQNH